MEKIGLQSVWVIGFLVAFLVFSVNVDATEEKSQELTILTWNIRHGRGLDNVLDLDRIAQTILDSGADIVVLNEVDKNWGSRSNYTDQPTILGEKTGFHTAFFPSLDNSNNSVTRQYGNLIMSRFPIIEQDGFYLPNHKGGERRSVNRVVVDLGTRNVVVYGTHLTIVRDELIEQAKAINEAAATETEPVILAGDLNARPLTSEMRELRNNGFIDTFMVLNPGVPGYTFPAELASARIDFIYVEESLFDYIVSASLMETDASDHHGVILNMSFD